MSNIVSKSLLLAACVLAVSFALSTPVGHAHYQIDDGRWWFGGSTYGAADDENKVDPNNLLFYPGWETKELVDAHFNDHIGEPDREPNEWTEHQNFDTSIPACRSNQFVRYRRTGPTSDPFEPVETDFHGAMVDVGEGGLQCANRYHIRFWGDAEHERLTSTQHTEREAWVLGAAHYEDVINEENTVGHAPTMPWETVEFRVVMFMRPHAVVRRWKCLPNSFGMYQRFRSDGRISRISRRHGGDNTQATTDDGKC